MMFVLIINAILIYDDLLIAQSMPALFAIQI